MNEDTTPQESFYRLNIFLDGNGAHPHKIIKSYSILKLLDSAWDDERYDRTIWVVWKEFGEQDISRHLVSCYPNNYKSVDEILDRVTERDNEIGEPIPVPENPPEQWV